MISIIISSANSKYLQQVTENVAQTIGTIYEIIAIDNSEGKYSMCYIYNQGVARAKYNILCFMHEDILIKTSNWGQNVIDTFGKDPKLGLIGLVGGAYKPLAPSGWGGIGPQAYYANIIQSFKYADTTTTHHYRNPLNEKLSKVACVDGVWFCTTKNVAGQCKFDEQTFTGFHVYDIDFSLSVGQKYTVGVIYDVLIEHFSEGNYDKNWLLDTIKFHEKWNLLLPINFSDLSDIQVFNTEKATFKHFINHLLKFNLPLSSATKMLNMNNRFLKLNLKLYLKLQYYIFIKRYIKTNATVVLK